MAQLVDRSMSVEARWQVRWKASRAATGRSQTFFSPLASRCKCSAQRDAERLKAHVDLHHNACDVQEALAALGFVEVIAKAPSTGETLASWAERWALTRPGVTARSKHDYLTILRTHVLPVLGHLPVEQISRSDVEAWVSAIEARVAGKTLRNLHGVRIRRGLAASEEMCFLTHGEWALLHGCLERTSRLGRPVDATLGQDLALLLVGSGLRYSEATALQAKHLDLLGSVCTVSIVQAWERQPGGTYLLEEPRTRRSQLKRMIAHTSLAHSGAERADQMFHLIALAVVLSILAHSSSDVPIAQYFARRRTTRPSGDVTLSTDEPSGPPAALS